MLNGPWSFCLLALLALTWAVGYGLRSRHSLPQRCFRRDGSRATCLHLLRPSQRTPLDDVSQPSSTSPVNLTRAFDDDPPVDAQDASTPTINAIILGSNASVSSISLFLFRAAAVGLSTGSAILVFKKSIIGVQELLYETVASLLPKPVFYWPIIIYPVLGACAVSVISLINSEALKQNIDGIARSTSSRQETKTEFNLMHLLIRGVAAVFTLGSGCSLGPEGTAVELGAGLSRVFGVSVGPSLSEQQNRFLFLAGTAAGVAAGFNAPITGVFFALECGNRYLRRNTLKFERVDEGPRADIAAIGTLLDFSSDYI